MSRKFRVRVRFRVRFRVRVRVRVVARLVEQEVGAVRQERRVEEGVEVVGHERRVGEARDQAAQLVLLRQADRRLQREQTQNHRAEREAAGVRTRDLLDHADGRRVSTGCQELGARTRGGSVRHGEACSRGAQQQLRDGLAPRHLGMRALVPLARSAGDDTQRTNTGSN